MASLSVDTTPTLSSRSEGRCSSSRGRSTSKSKMPRSLISISSESLSSPIASLSTQARTSIDRPPTVLKILRVMRTSRRTRRLRSSLRRSKRRSVISRKSSRRVTSSLRWKILVTFTATRSKMMPLPSS